jgi:drug/metabolite transporter (DMT)-like permease
MVLQAVGLVFVPSLESGIFFAIIPIFVKIIAAIFLGEVSGWRQNASMTLSVLSLIAMIVCGGASLTMRVDGAVILLISCVFMACSNVIMRHVRGSYGPLQIAFAVMTTGFLLCNLMALITGAKDGAPGAYWALFWDFRFMAASAYLGVLSSFVTILLMYYMVRALEAVKAAIFGNLGSAISVAAGAILLNERLYWYHVIFTALILVGVIGVSIAGMRQEPRGRK